MLTLVLKEGGSPVTLKLEEDVIAIGRAKDNNIIIKNIKASRRHARIERIGATYQITDLGSGNGTKVNGKKIDFQALKQGDEIAIGDARLTLKGIDDGIDALDVADDIRLEETDDKLEIADDKDTEITIKDEGETEVEAPAVQAKPARTLGKPAAGPVKPAPGKPALGKPAAGAAPAKPGLKKPLGRQASK